jgi:hypothetical protein
MERFYSRILPDISQDPDHLFTSKTTLMISGRIINRLIILSFFVLIGYCLATSIAVRSGIGILLALVSLGAGVTFLYLLGKKQDQPETEEFYQHH